MIKTVVDPPLSTVCLLKNQPVLGTYIRSRSGVYFNVPDALWGYVAENNCGSTLDNIPRWDCAEFLWPMMSSVEY